jgi:hypothetical protein
MPDRLSPRLAELYLYGGPAHKARAANALRSLQDTCNEHAAILTLPPLLMDIHRAITAFQDGDLGATTRALERSEARCREFDVELLWHIERFRALMRLNMGHVSEGRSALLALHRRALGREPLFGTAVLCAYDQSVVFASSEPRCERWHRSLAFDRFDPPNIWALKVRALAAGGSTDQARSALASVPVERLANLPCDRDYLGTLGALARAVLALQALDYARAIYDLLVPYPEHFAVNLSFVCEGSTSQLLGMLARAMGDHARARQHFELAITTSEQAGLTAAAAESQLELQLCRH